MYFSPNMKNNFMIEGIRKLHRNFLFTATTYLYSLKTILFTPMTKPSTFLVGVFGTLLSLIFTEGHALAKTRFGVSQIARAVTVRIVSSGNNPDPGSGIIANKQGDVYTIVTNAHVLCKEGRNSYKKCSPKPGYTITTFDKHQHQVSSATVAKIGDDLDIAIIKFRSPRNYSVAQFAKSASVKNQDLVYSAGFPGGGSELKFNSGKIVANTEERLSKDGGGYTTLYDADTLPGMSGSGIFNSEGQVVAIHGQGDKFKSGTEISAGGDLRISEKIGVNRGIPIGRLQFTNNQVTAVNRQVSAPTTADAFLIDSFNKFITPDLKRIESEKRAALVLVNKALAKQPNYLYAYLLRGWIYTQLQDNKSAIQDFDRAISLDNKIYSSYLLRSSTRAVINDLKGAASDLDRAIALKPDSTIALENRGSLRLSTGDLRGALEDFNRALSLNSLSTIALVGRCNANSGLGNHQSALQDCETAITQTGRKNSAAFSGRAVAKFRSGDKKGAIEDIDDAIKLDKKDAGLYINRGSFRYASNDKQGALSDFRTALGLGSANINMYLGIALIEEENGNLREALAFYTKALNEYSRQGNLFNQAALIYKITEIENKIR
jgi:tetratricopeptide (TPR) repeat protein/V8-like Glu-specific endopeptidase